MTVEQDEVFDKAADLFAVMSTPIRLRIISELCQGEKNVGQLLENIGVAQPNMSQHLNIMFRSGVLGKRRQGAQVFYRIADETAAKVCRAVCTQVAIGADMNDLINKEFV
ncbi:MAG: Biofilm growth-associated repressor [Pseudomonadota bacterium]|jgi:DNA-binding transcriptional ArsR family regulator